MRVAILREFQGRFPRERLGNYSMETPRLSSDFSTICIRSSTHHFGVAIGALFCDPPGRAKVKPFGKA